MSLSAGVVLHERDHAFKLKTGTKHVCAGCGQHRLHPDHGAFSYQAYGRMFENRHVRAKTTKLWLDMLVSLILASDLAFPCRRVEVYGRVCFPNLEGRDEGNHRFVWEKFVGDALQRAGYLANDEWHTYRFRELDLDEDDLDGVPLDVPGYCKGRQWTRLFLQPG